MERIITQFSNLLHRRLYYESASLLSIEKTTAWIKDEALLDSCYQLYNYVNNAFDDMLEKPEENFFDPSDPAFDIINMPTIIADNMTFHRMILMKFLGIAFLSENDFITIPNDDYDKLIKSTKNKYPAKEINEKFKVPFTFNDLFANLKRRGIIITRMDDQTIIKNDKYPQMFLAAKLLYDASEVFHKKTKRTPQWFINLDFRAIDNPLREPEVDDLLDPLTQNEKENAQELLDFATRKNLQMNYDNLAGIRCLEATYNKRQLFNIKWMARFGNRLMVMLPEPETVEHNLLLQKIDQMKDAEEIKNFCADNLVFCHFCGKKPCVQRNAYKRNWVILGRPAKKLIRSCVAGYSAEGLAMSCQLDNDSFRKVKSLIEILTDIYL